MASAGHSSNAAAATVHRPTASTVAARRSDGESGGPVVRGELLAGYAEIVKYGLIDDPAFFAWCEANGAAVVSGDQAAQGHAVAHSVRAKARVVAADRAERAAMVGIEPGREDVIVAGALSLLLRA